MDDDKLGKTEAHSIVVRSFEPSDKLEVQRIFYEGMMEMVSDTAFRGLRHHPESLLLYAAFTNSCLWVAVLEGKVVGLVAAVGHRTQTGTVELQRMSVDQNCRRRGVGMVLGRKVLEYAVTGGYSTVVLGTTAYNSAAHRLYQSLGFSCVGVTNGYTAPGTRQSVLERVFYRVRHHHYSLDVQRTKLKIL
ncbi:N-acetylaspartate synthetase-like isoform X2 [Sphaeramia orbicularis]|uniref:N-acetylaspartate synthetase-like isoform X2 n=1 Tax=Sphaeramia orbicularis TaxID=375764 RepID=UPI00117EEFA9|nr:N-acetylaspartate synthetase-like isoform X2 [Sphaeramia orbicularis]